MIDPIACTTYVWLFLDFIFVRLYHLKENKQDGKSRMFIKKAWTISPPSERADEGREGGRCTTTTHHFFSKQPNNRRVKGGCLDIVGRYVMVRCQIIVKLWLDNCVAMLWTVHAWQVIVIFCIHDSVAHVHSHIAIPRGSHGGSL